MTTIRQRILQMEYSSCVPRIFTVFYSTGSALWILPDKVSQESAWVNWVEVVFLWCCAGVGGCTAWEFARVQLIYVSCRVHYYVKDVNLSYTSLSGWVEHLVAMLRHRKQEISWENGKFPGKMEILEMKNFLSEQNRPFSRSFLHFQRLNITP